MNTSFDIRNTLKNYFKLNTKIISLWPGLLYNNVPLDKSLTIVRKKLENVTILSQRTKRSIKFKFFI